MTNTNFLALSPTTSLQQIEASLTSQCGGKITGVTLQSHVRAVPYFNIENFEVLINKSFENRAYLKSLYY